MLLTWIFAILAGSGDVSGSGLMRERVISNNRYKMEHKKCRKEKESGNQFRTR